MKPGSKILQGSYFDGRQALGSPATLIWGSAEAALIGERVSNRYPVADLRVTPRVGNADRFVAFPDGGQLQCADQAVLDGLPQAFPGEGVVAWLERRWGVALAALVVIVAILLGGYFYGLPLAAERVAARIPPETEQGLGREIVAWLDQNTWFRPSHLDGESQNRIRAGFAGLCKGLPMEPYYRLEFRDSPFIGANAFALPGGTIVITDEMVSVARSPEEVLAVLAHEIGHVELRHTMRHLLQDSAVGVVAATLTGDASTLSVAVAGLPAVLAQARYSRQFETEADVFAFRLLKGRGISPAAFADLMERLAARSEGKGHAFAFVSTHPVTAERVERARAAAGR